MTEKEFEKVQRGSIIRHKRSSHSYVVDAVNNWVELKEVVAVRTITVMHPAEWDLVKR